MAHFELAEKPLAILPPGQAAPIVQPLVILDTHHQALLVGHPLDLQRLVVAQHQRLDAAYVLLLPQGLAEDHTVQLVGHGHDGDVALAHAGEHFAEQIGELLRGIGIQRWIGVKGLAREGLPQPGVFGQRPQGAAVQRADVDFADQAESLQLVERG